MVAVRVVLVAGLAVVIQSHHYFICFVFDDDDGDQKEREGEMGKLLWICVCIQECHSRKKERTNEL